MNNPTNKSYRITGISSPSVTVEFEIKNRQRILSRVRIGAPIYFDPTKKEAHIDGGSGAEYIAIWDTGAPYTVVVPKIIRTEGLLPRGFREFAGVGSKFRERPVYPASVVFSNSSGLYITYAEVTMLENDKQLGGADFLIGMDIIANGETRIGNKNNKFWFSYKPEQGNE